MEPLQELAPGLWVVHTGTGHGLDFAHSNSLTQLELKGYPLYSTSMKCEIIQTHIVGKRSSKAEMGAAEPVVGELYLYDWHAGNSSNRNLRVADIKETVGNVERSV